VININTTYIARTVILKILKFWNTKFDKYKPTVLRHRKYIIVSLW